MTPKPHPLPWSIHNGWLSLETQYRGDEERPYALHAGRHDGVIVSLSVDELRALRERIDRVLAAPFRVIVAGANDVSYGDPAVADAVRTRLDALRTAHPNLEVVSESTPGEAGAAAEQWAVDAGVPLWLYPSIGDAIADGGSRVLLVAGPDAPDVAEAAYQRPIAVQLVRLANRPLQEQVADHLAHPPVADVEPDRPTVVDRPDDNLVVP